MGDGAFPLQLGEDLIEKGEGGKDVAVAFAHPGGKQPLEQSADLFVFRPVRKKGAGGNGAIRVKRHGDALPSLVAKHVVARGVALGEKADGIWRRFQHLIAEKHRGVSRKVKNQLVVGKVGMEGGRLLGIFLFSHHDDPLDLRDHKFFLHTVPSVFCCCIRL